MQTQNVQNATHNWQFHSRTDLRTERDALAVDARVEEPAKAPTEAAIEVVAEEPPAEDPVEVVAEEPAVDYARPVDAALEDVAPEDALVFVPENPDAMADDSWKRTLWIV